VVTRPPVFADGLLFSFVNVCDELGIDGEARALWCSVYPALSQAQAGVIGAVLGRASAQVLRLALTLAVLDRTGVFRTCEFPRPLEVGKTVRR